jgi:Flp pilus assembly protein TadD
VLGRHEEAIRSLTRATELAGRTSRMLAYLGYVTGLAGRKEEALGLLAQLRQRAADDYVPPYFQALVLAGVAERAGALAELRRAVDSRDTMARDLAIDTPWWSFREEPAYQVLLRELRLLA